MDKKLDRIKDNITSGAEGAVLGKLWRKVIADLSIASRLKLLIDMYATKTGGISSRVATEKRKTKASLVNNIISEDMTWKVFYDLLHNVVGVKKFAISIKLYHANGSVTVHSVLALKPESIKPEEVNNERVKLDFGQRDKDNT